MRNAQKHPISNSERTYGRDSPKISGRIPTRFSESLRAFIRTLTNTCRGIFEEFQKDFRNYPRKISECIPKVFPKASQIVLFFRIFWHSCKNLRSRNLFGRISEFGEIPEEFSIRALESLCMNPPKILGRIASGFSVETSVISPIKILRT